MRQSASQWRRGRRACGVFVVRGFRQGSRLHERRSFFHPVRSVAIRPNGRCRWRDDRTGAVEDGRGLRRQTCRCRRMARAATGRPAALLLRRRDRRDLVERGRNVRIELRGHRFVEIRRLAPRVGHVEVLSGRMPGEREHLAGGRRIEREHLLLVLVCHRQDHVGMFDVVRVQPHRTVRGRVDAAVARESGRAARLQRPVEFFAGVQALVRRAAGRVSQRGIASGRPSMNRGTIAGVPVDITLTRETA